MSLLGDRLCVINVGLSSFARAIAAAGGEVTEVAWAPPAGGDRAVGLALARLVNHPRIEAANRLAYAAYLEAQPALEGIGPARALLPGMGRRTILHAGPPIEWARMCGPMQGAIVGAVLFEGWAEDADRAARLAASGKIAFAPCHDYGAVGPMAGVISPSMPVWAVRDLNGGGLAFSNLNEGLGKALRFGANGAEVIDALALDGEDAAPGTRGRPRHARPVELKPLMAQALHMGDEVHNRNAAASSLLLKRLVPAMLRSKTSRRAVEEAVTFMAGNDHFFLNLSMAACKAMLDAARGFAGEQHGDGDGAERGRVRHPAERLREPLVHRPRAAHRRPLFSRATASRTRPPTWATAPSPRPRGWAASPWRRHRRSSSSSAALPPMRPPTRSRWGTSRLDVTRR